MFVKPSGNVRIDLSFVTFSVVSAFFLGIACAASVSFVLSYTSRLNKFRVGKFTIGSNAIRVITICIALVSLILLVGVYFGVFHRKRKETPDRYAKNNIKININITSKSETSDQKSAQNISLLYKTSNCKGEVTTSAVNIEQAFAVSTPPVLSIPISIKKSSLDICDSKTEDDMHSRQNDSTVVATSSIVVHETSNRESESTVLQVNTEQTYISDKQLLINASTNNKKSSLDVYGSKTEDDMHSRKNDSTVVATSSIVVHETSNRESENTMLQVNTEQTYVSDKQLLINASTNNKKSSLDICDIKTEDGVHSRQNSSAVTAEQFFLKDRQSFGNILIPIVIPIHIEKQPTDINSETNDDKSQPCTRCAAQNGNFIPVENSLENKVKESKTLLGEYLCASSIIDKTAVCEKILSFIQEGSADLDECKSELIGKIGRWCEKRRLCKLSPGLLHFELICRIFYEGELSSKKVTAGTHDYQNLMIDCLLSAKGGVAFFANEKSLFLQNIRYFLQTCNDISLCSAFLRDVADTSCSILGLKANDPSVKSLRKAGSKPQAGTATAHNKCWPDSVINEAKRLENFLFQETGVAQDEIIKAIKEEQLHVSSGCGNLEQSMVLLAGLSHLLVASETNPELPWDDIEIDIVGPGQDTIAKIAEKDQFASLSHIKEEFSAAAAAGYAMVSKGFSSTFGKAKGAFAKHSHRLESGVIDLPGTKLTESEAKQPLKLHQPGVDRSNYGAIGGR